VAPTLDGKPGEPVVAPHLDTLAGSSNPPGVAPDSTSNTILRATLAEQPKCSWGGITAGRSGGEKDYPLPMIPGYEVIRVLGWGGMGVVYLARHVQLNRQVALKMVLSGIQANPQQLVRFNLEAEALACLHHPNIVQVYDIGEHEHCPYLAMEFVQGGSLDAYLRGKPVAPEEAACLMETLARGMHAAHQRGIVHRDLKPGNVLLGGEPDASLAQRIPKIADFGLVKKLESNTHTSPGAIVGTPSYMAPEQALGRTREVGPQADVYSLGAILYELLTGCPPFLGESAMQTLQMVISQEPKPIRQLQPGRVPRDLDTICMKSLAKAPAKRYATALDLADDLARFRDGRPITARRVGRFERVVKWARRRPSAAALVAVSLAAIVALVSLGVWAYLRVSAARYRAEQRSQLTRQAVDDMYTKVAEQWLGNEPGKDDLKRDFLLKAATIYEKLAQEAEEADPALRRETARAYYRTGEIYRQLGESGQAEQAYRRAIALQEQLVQQQPDRTKTALHAAQQDLATSYIDLGELFRRNDQLEQARASYGDARVILERLTAEMTDDPLCYKELARSHYNDALVLDKLGNVQEAASECDQAIALLDEAARLNPDRPDVQQELARVQINKGYLLRKLKDVAGAGNAYAAAIKILGNLQCNFSRKPDYRFEKAVCHRNRGNLELVEGHNPEGAAQDYQEAQGLLRELANDFPSRPIYQVELAHIYNSLGDLASERKNLAGARDAWMQAADLFDRLSRSDPRQISYLRGLSLVESNLAWLYLR
jgi:tetratricopeptide (TPR) repeat protein